MQVTNMREKRSAKHVNIRSLFWGMLKVSSGTVRRGNKRLHNNDNTSFLELYSVTSTVPQCFTVESLTKST